jgi:hypothetical protein
VPLYALETAMESRPMNTRIRLVTTAFAATLVFLATAIGSASGQDVTLQYRWTKGEEIRHRFVQQTTTTVTGLPVGASGGVEANMTQVVRTTVDDVAADGAATLHYAYESARWETNTPTGTMVFDTASSDPANAGFPSAVRDMLTAMVGESFVVVMTPSGQITKVDGIDRLMEKMFKSFQPDPATVPLMETLKNNFSEDAIRKALTQASIQFPQQPLKPGDTWDRSATTTNPLVGGQMTTTLFTLKDVDTSSGSQVSTIATRVTIQSADEPTAGLPGLKVRLTDSSGEGELIFDVTKGRLLRSTTRITVSMEMSMPGPDGNAMNLQSKASSSISMELLPPPR